MAVVIRSFCYWPRLSRAERRGALEIWMSPVKGMYISRITKIAPETADAAATRAVSVAHDMSGDPARQLAARLH